MRSNKIDKHEVIKIRESGQHHQGNDRCDHCVELYDKEEAFDVINTLATKSMMIQTDDINKMNPLSYHHLRGKSHRPRT